MTHHTEILVGHKKSKEKTPKEKGKRRRVEMKSMCENNIGSKNVDKNDISIVANSNLKHM